MTYCLRDCAPLSDSADGADNDEESGNGAKDSPLPTPQKLRANGRFVTSPAANRGAAGDASRSPRSRKPHRWSGGGAERAIIADGLKLVGDTAMESPSKPLAEAFEQQARTRKPAGDITPGDIDMPDAPGSGDDRRPIKSTSGGIQQTSRARDDATSRTRACKCGKTAGISRACISCEEPHCTREGFHLACVGLEKRVPGWRCDDCAASSS